MRSEARGGERRGVRRGAEGAAALLSALATADRPLRKRELRAALGLPRSSLDRIVAILARSELVTTPGRGLVAPGPLALRLLAARDAGLDRRDLARVSARALAGPGRPRPSLAMLRRPEALRVMPPRRAASRKLRIGFSNAGLDNPWRFALVHTVEFACFRYAGDISTLAVAHAGDSAERQAEDIASLDVDGLVVSAADGPALREALADKAARIPVVLVDRGIGEGPQASFITSDNAAIGRTTALWLGERLGGRGRVLMLAGKAGTGPAGERFAAAAATLAAFPGIEAPGPVWTGWRREAGRAAVADLLRQGEAIDGVWCDSGLQGAGSIAAFLSAGVPPGAIPPHTGGDLNLMYKLAIRHRIPLASRDYPPAMGLRAVEVLLDLLRGRAVPALVEVPSIIVATEGHATPSVAPDVTAERHVRWDLPDELILAAGLGPGYEPMLFRVNYPGNRYNRSAARLGARAREPAHG